MSWQGKPVKAPSSYPALKGKLVKASSFTDGSVKTFFAPGQTEYAPATATYENPTSWRPRGSLLKMPQVVWLSCHFPYSFFDDTSVPPFGEPHTTFRDPLEPDASWDPYFAVWGGASFSGYERTWGNPGGEWDYPGYVENLWTVSEVVDGTGSIPGSMPLWIDGVYQTWWVDDRPFYTARGDLDTVFQSVKSSIESIRPGKTWVYINHWWFTQTPQFETCPHLIAPPTDTPYVGTDFLHMYFGLASYQGPNWSAPPGSYPSPYGLHGTENMNGYSYRITSLCNPEPGTGLLTAMKSQVHDASVLRVRAATDRFAGFRVMLFGTDVPLINWENTSGGWVTGTFSNVTDDHTTFLQQEATDLSSYGYSYEGMGTGISADTIKNKIAAHFGFNPSTGADL